MIKIENVVTMSPEQYEAVIRGMRNPLNSWDKSDSYTTYVEDAETQNTAPFEFFVGDEDLKLMQNLSKAGSSHRKYMRMMTVHLDITAPLYWWKEFDTYKVGTVANSCSTMHKIHEKEFTLRDFSHEHLYHGNLLILKDIIDVLNRERKCYLEDKHKGFWWQMIQLLPSSYNQKRTIMLNYEVLGNMYHDRKNHKLDEWVLFCEWIEKLPYSEIITQ